MLNRITDAHLLPSSPAFAKQMLAAVFCPVAICNGQEYLDEDGDALEQLFKIAGIEYDVADNLFEDKKDLTKYATIAFGTTYVEPEKVKAIIDFDKSNLRTVIVFDQISLNIVKKYGEGLNLNIIAFNSCSLINYLDGDEDVQPIIWDALNPTKGCRLY